ncbi:hypothetical protein LTR10_015586 [Elasticomyces elasticus]|uniref:Uncharacterized protein n=1 Tax=Exophiala sideris TaxID=1016849 RepID=A0ABR0JLM2_9EURO|nr:hypothetical protein LTR10_015586 [Elasticomyces elasticus]KAK5032298.1 hypothetical protein LTR13_007516 [Exophiala sideris]KAK5036296.1 hypothetical protein LTS07_002022 [Exophiala sideris]KAK5066679.1 hypothetical protein LTR69_002026 [Exophiala sideris]KAK5180501.1 hypothetical protein LTR44_007259 [Eurotiomycetes sp. CCFEE 6388]
MKTTGAFRGTIAAKISNGITKAFLATPQSEATRRLHADGNGNGFKALAIKSRVSQSPIPAFKGLPYFPVTSPRKALNHSLIRQRLNLGNLVQHSPTDTNATPKDAFTREMSPEISQSQQPRHPLDFMGRPQVYRAFNLFGADSKFASCCYRPEPRTTSWGLEDYIRRQEAERVGRPFQWPPLVVEELAPVDEEEGCAWCRGWATPMDVDPPGWQNVPTILMPGVRI